MQLFYDAAFSEQNPLLNQDETHHCTKVLRKKPGETIFITNGRGALFEAVIKSFHGQQLELEVLHHNQYQPPKGHLHLAVAPTKNNDRLEWMVEKCTEIGVQEISFIYCEHSERQVLKLSRLVKKAVAAMKQSVDTFLPVLHDALPLQRFVTGVSLPHRFIAHYKPDQPLLQEMIIKNEPAVILIGPEGDFSEKEVQMAENHGFKPVNLGYKRLRTETAGLVACHTHTMINH